MNCRFVFLIVRAAKTSPKKADSEIRVESFLLIYLEETNLRVDQRLFCPKTTVTRLGEPVPFEPN